MKLIAPLFCIALLTACTEMHDTSARALDDIGDGTAASYNKVRGYMNLGRQDAQAKPQGKIQKGYCYKTYQDVVCYAQPLIGEEYRLVGFQEPAPAITTTTVEPLPLMQAPVSVAPAPFGKPSAPLNVISTTTTVTTTTPVKKKSAEDIISGSPNAPKKKLKEVKFDPEELQPKELVPVQSEQ